MITSCEWLPLVRLHVPRAHASEACESFSEFLHSLQNEQYRNRCKLQADSKGFGYQFMGVAYRVWLICKSGQTQTGVTSMARLPQVAGVL